MPRLVLIDQNPDRKYFSHPLTENKASPFLIEWTWMEWISFTIYFMCFCAFVDRTVKWRQTAERLWKKEGIGPQVGLRPGLTRVEPNKPESIAFNGNSTKEWPNTGLVTVHTGEIVLIWSCLSPLLIRAASWHQYGIHSTLSGDQRGKSQSLCVLYMCVWRMCMLVCVVCECEVDAALKGTVQQLADDTGPRPKSCTGLCRFGLHISLYSTLPLRVCQCVFVCRRVFVFMMCMGIWVYVCVRMQALSCICVPVCACA